MGDLFMSKNRKQLVVIVLSIVVAYIVFKLLKALVYALIVGIVLYIGYNMATKVLGAKGSDEIE
jgi:ABC-type transport system involved in multi-copper enzyme maturation permease subunit